MEPRDWLLDPRLFGSREKLRWREVPNDPFKRAEREAARVQSRMVAGLRLMSARRSPHVRWKEVADSPLFPYTYNALVKAVRGSSGLTLAMYAATRLALAELAGPAAGSLNQGGLEVTWLEGQTGSPQTGV